jgi:DNA-binding beta-propeller fold protein YncE
MAYVFSFWWGFHGSDEGQFDNPHGIAVNSEGSVFVADTENNRIQKFRSDGSFIRTWGSLGTGNGQFDGPFGVAVDPEGFLYVTERDNHRIQKFSNTGEFVTSWGSLGSEAGQFQFPLGIDTDGYGKVYVVDNGNHRIQKFTNTGEFVTSWGSLGAENGQLKNPTDIAVLSHPASESLGTVWVSDSGNSRIQVFHVNGSFSTKWGSFGSGNGQFHTPFGIDVEAAPNPHPTVFVADTNNHRIQQFGFLGIFLTSWGSLGTQEEGKFKWPSQVAEYTPPGGTQLLYVADSGNNRIQVFFKQ